MRQESDDHDGEDERIDVQKEAHQERHRDLAEHQKMKKRFLRPGRMLDVACLMTAIIGDTRQEHPDWDRPLGSCMHYSEQAEATEILQVRCCAHCLGAALSS